MKRVHTLVLFYALVLLAAFDAHTVWSRFTLAAPDPVAWHKVIGALLIQAIIAGLLAAYLWFLSHREPSYSLLNTIVGTSPFRYAPVIALGVLVH